MLLTILILIACAILGVVAAPLMLKVVPPNPYYGFPTRDLRKNPKRWIAVNAFAGRAVVGAVVLVVILLMMWNGTWLRSGWAQIAVFIVAVGAAVGASFWYERR